jgi:hypothetical protein
MWVERRQRLRRAEMTEEERDEIEDLLAYRYDIPIWEDEQELPHFSHANLIWWLEAMGHPKAHRGCCKTCGCATTCMASAFYDAVVATTLRQLDSIGALVKPERVPDAPGRAEETQEDSQ